MEFNKDLKDLEELQKKAEQEKANTEIEKERAVADAKARAEAETKEISTIVQDTSKAIQVKLNQKALKKIEDSPEIDKKMEETTNVLVDLGLETQKNEVQARNNESKKSKLQTEYDLSQDQYRAFGQDSCPEENWKKRLIKYGYNFWFCVIFAICFVSLAPFYCFMKVIQTQRGILKFVAISVGVLLLLACLGGLTYWVLKASGAV